jgi:hypothetical protein
MSWNRTRPGVFSLCLPAMGEYRLEIADFFDQTYSLYLSASSIPISKFQGRDL